jgi:hypothetical protein
LPHPAPPTATPDDDTGQPVRGHRQAPHLLGCVNSVDQGYANWGGGNGRVNYFIGDRIGTLAITYATGQADEIPLVFGYTVWWRENCNIGYAPFKTDSRDHALLDRALCVANGIKGGHHPYYLTIALRDEPVAALRFDDNPDKAGYPVVLGLTFE